MYHLKIVWDTVLLLMSYIVFFLSSFCSASQFDVIHQLYLFFAYKDIKRVVTRKANVGNRCAASTYRLDKTKISQIILN